MLYDLKFLISHKTLKHLDCFTYKICEIAKQKNTYHFSKVLIISQN